MSITQAVCSSFKVEVLDGVHNFATGGDVFKLALYTQDATLNSSTLVYTPLGESSGQGYTAGGQVLTSLGVGSAGTLAYLGFQPATWANSTLSAGGALIYNSSKGNKAVAVLNFGGTYSSHNSLFTVTFPPNNSSTALLIVN